MLSVLLLVVGVGLTTAQVPGFGGCPEFESLQDFDMNKFIGTWYEAERYVNIFEAGTRCVKTNYTKTADGRYLVANEIMNRFTSVRRVLEGEIRLIVKGHESKLNVRYPNLPIPYESQMMVLDTDYDNFSVMWSCSSLGIINTQNAWILTREKFAPGTVLQKAYGVLDKYKLSRTFFVKTDQNSCELNEQEPEHGNAAGSSSAGSSGSKKPAKKTNQKKNGQSGSGLREDEQLKSEEMIDIRSQQQPQPQPLPQPQPQQQPAAVQPMVKSQPQSQQHQHQQHQQQHHHHETENKIPVPAPTPVPIAPPPAAPVSHDTAQKVENVVNA